MQITSKRGVPGYGSCGGVLVVDAFRSSGGEGGVDRSNIHTNIYILNVSVYRYMQLLC